jgi:tetratricopeptide (TPR) repeat protein
MRGVQIVAVALGLCLAGTQTVRAGVYNPAEPEWQVSDRFDEFLSTTLTPLRQFGTEFGTRPVHKRALLASHLAVAGKTGLSVEERLSLSAYLIRIPKIGRDKRPDYREAINILSPAQRDPRERDNFLVYANLATAEFLDGQYQRARDYLADALRLWPTEWSRLSKERRDWLVKMGWNEEQFKLRRRAETYFLKYIRLRAKERPPAFGRPNLLGESIVPLFEGGDPPTPVRFVGESGRYEAGKLAAAEQKKLPPDAVAIVEQLLIWLPHDDRLYWLLGELLNARGEYLTAGEQVFASIGDKIQFLSSDPSNKLNPVANASSSLKVRDLSARHLAEFSRLPELHRDHLRVLVEQAKADKAAASAPAAQPVAEKTPTPPPSPSRKLTDKPAAKSDGALPIDMRSLTVGFVAGLIVMLFALWQVREVRRRLHTRAPSSPHVAAHGLGAEQQEGRPG